MPNIRTKSLQAGQAIVLIALLILVLFGMLGLAIDSGRAYVDRRDQQAAVDAAALAAGDWYDNWNDITVHAVPKSVQLYQNDLRLYAAYTSYSHGFANVGVNNSLAQDTYTYGWPNGYTLTVVATNTLFNGYQFQFKSTHSLPLVFMQIFGGAPTVDIEATAGSIVRNQRQNPAILTLSTGTCSLDLKGSSTLTILGDAYSNGTACVDASLQEAGNCYGAAGSTCSSASYYCYDAAGDPPIPPPCPNGWIQGQPVVPAPTLPDPGYVAPSYAYYNSTQSYNQWNRGTWTEMNAGVYPGNFHLSGGTASCAFLDPGVYTWQGGYQSDATGSLLSNELKAPDEELYSAPGTTNLASPQFWNQNGLTCAGHFTVSNGAAQTILLGPTCTDLSPQTPNPCHSGVTDTLSRNNQWGVELTSVRFDTFADNVNVQPDPCLPTACRRESAPSECQLTPNIVVGGPHSPSNIGISITMTQNAPGAQYYNVYLNPAGCKGNQSGFGWVGRFDAPGFVNGTPVGPYPSNSTPWVLGAAAPGLQPAAGATLYDLSDQQVANPAKPCYSQVRTFNCNPPDDELAPQCFSGCPPPPGLLSQENAAMKLEYLPYTGGDVANENYCQYSPPSGSGSTSAPCFGATATPGAVQFYMPAGACMSQNAKGATYVFSGIQYNWLVIYQPASNTCSNTMNGGASTQYIGTIYTPGANWTFNGGNRAPLAGQVICYTAFVSGGASIGIDYNPNYAPAPPAARLIA